MKSASRRVRKWHDRNQRSEGNVDPGQVTIGFRKLVELRLLADPEDTQSHKAHQINKHAWRECAQGKPKIVLTVNRLAGRWVYIEHEQRHGDGEDTDRLTKSAFQQFIVAD